MAEVKNPYPLCERDGFPMIKTDGQLQCVAEYLDRCIEHQKVVDLIQRGKTIYYVFENGHELAMLCFCCGESLVFKASTSHAATCVDGDWKRCPSVA